MGMGIRRVCSASCPPELFLKRSRTYSIAASSDMLPPPMLRIEAGASRSSTLMSTVSTG